MRILLYNETFSPIVGGVETIVKLLAQYLDEQGEEVAVATQTPDTEANRFEVVRQPSKRTMTRLAKHSDLIHFHSFHPWLLLQAVLNKKKNALVLRRL